MFSLVALARQASLGFMMAVAVLTGWASPAAAAGGDTAPRGARVLLRSEAWQFPAGRPAYSSEDTAPDFSVPAEPGGGFTLVLDVDLRETHEPATLLEVPGVLGVRLRQHDRANRSRQNYPAFAMPDGSVPVLEASLALRSAEHPDWKEMTVGVPLAMLMPPASSTIDEADDSRRLSGRPRVGPGSLATPASLPRPFGRHEVVLAFTGVRWSMYVDGRLVDNDFPFGVPPWAVRNRWTFDSGQVKRAAIHFPALVPERLPAAAPQAVPAPYWTPPGHNAWVGDVATIFHAGRYHLFYLYDRRHHASKFGKGAHYFEHLSTADFKTWTEHEAATPLEEPWECIGTGTPFVADGKLCLAYGLHTERIFPEETTTLPAQRAWLAAHGRTGSFGRSTPGVPVGATYAVSGDGVADFRKTWTFFHPCRNPSVYGDPSGGLRMLANSHSQGMWESESVDGGWRCLNRAFPPGGDCTFYFRWGTFDYIIGGFQNLWRKPADAPDTAYDDLAARGMDFYDGLNVPAISQVGDGRWLMAGWTDIRGWGGNLVIRQLVQQSDGRIGSRWMTELVPPTGPAAVLPATAVGSELTAVPSRSFLLEFQLRPAATGAGRLGIALLPSSGEQAACELQIRPADRRAQFGPGSPARFADDQPSLREGGKPHRGRNYAVENLLGTDRAFTVRLLVKGCDKIGGSLVDAEIAGQRTMISYRPDLTVKRLAFRTEGVELGDVRIAPLAE